MKRRAEECEQCGVGNPCRLRRGSCRWAAAEYFQEEMDALRAADIDAWNLLDELIERSRHRGLRGHHSYPMRTAAPSRMGELKATAADGELLRLYYGEPDHPADVVVGLHVKPKRIYEKGAATRVGQNRQIRVAKARFIKWLHTHGHSSTS